MSKEDVKEITDKVISKGGILVKLYFDMQDKDKDSLQPLMTDLVNNRLMKEAGMVYCYGSIEEPIMVKDVYSTVAELTMLMDDPKNLFRVVFNYAPAGLEIIEPSKEVKFTSAQLQSILMDLSETSVNYSKYILEHLLDQKELENVKNAIQNRKLSGSRIPK